MVESEKEGRGNQKNEEEGACPISDKCKTDSTTKISTHGTISKLFNVSIFSNHFKSHLDSESSNSRVIFNVFARQMQLCNLFLQIFGT